MASKLSPVDLEVIGTNLTSVSEQMGYALQRTGRTIYVKESGDFGTGIVSPQGVFSAYPWSIGVSGFVGGECGPVIDEVLAREGLEPGDVILTNHPYMSHALATHLPDLHVIAPYFCGDEIVAYGWAFVHSSDIGGRVPSSISPSNTELFQEGLAIPPIKLMRRHVLNEDFLRMYRANVRTPGPNVGDIMAMIASLNIGRERIQTLCERYGPETVVDAQDQLIAYSAKKARAVLRRIPDGTYEFWDYLDDDFLSPYPIRIRLALTASDGEIHLDFSGTDPQTLAAFNLPRSPHGHSWFPVRLIGLINTLDPTIPLNAGIFRSVRVTTPRGSVLDPEPPAAVGVRHATGIRIQDVVNGALSLAMPNVMTACNGSIAIPLALAEPAAPDGERKVQVVQALVSGQGARYGADGVDGRDSNVSNMSNVPVESAESAGAIVIRKYALRADSGGPGRWRGGVGQIIEFAVTRDGCSIAARGTERLRFAPWGISGGMPGKPGRIVLNLGKADEQELGKIDVITLNQGQTLTVMTPGSGGFGDPFERPPGDVLADVRRGLVTIDGARSDYGVVILDDGVDEHETAGLRRSGLRPASGFFGFCPEREAWESVFGDQPTTALVGKLYELPSHSRYQKRLEIYRRIVPALKGQFDRLQEVFSQAEAQSAREMLSQSILETREK